MFFLKMLNQAMGVENICDSALKVETDADFLSINGYYVNVALHTVGRIVVFGIEKPNH